MNLSRWSGVIAVWTGLLLVDGSAQQDATAPRMISVGGVPVRVWTAGFDRRVTGQPVIALEAGSGADLETWKPVFAELAALGPVLAYDRLGLGQSGADPKTPTLARNIETLHDVLRELTAPPYVLVGHSLGGVIVRGSRISTQRKPRDWSILTFRTSKRRGRSEPRSCRVRPAGARCNRRICLPFRPTRRQGFGRSMSSCSWRCVTTSRPLGLGASRRVFLLA